MKSYIRPMVIFIIIGIVLGIVSRFIGLNFATWLIALNLIFIVGFSLMSFYRDDHGVISTIGRVYLIFSFCLLLGQISGTGLLGKALISIGKLIS